MVNLTDDEIMKALENCGKLATCGDCSMRPKEARRGTTGCYNELLKDALNLINRKDAEIEKLYKEVDRLSQCIMYNDGVVSDLEKDIVEAKAKAIKEFIERFKEAANTIANVVTGEITLYTIRPKQIDNLKINCTKENPKMSDDYSFDVGV